MKENVLNSLLPPAAKAHSKVQHVLFLVPLPKYDELYAMPNSSTVYFSLHCTSGYHYIALAPKAQNKSTFVMPIRKFEFKKVPFGLAQTHTCFQQLINKVLRGLPLAFGCLDDVFVVSEINEKHLKHLGTVFVRS